MKKKFIVLRKKKQNVSTDLTTESVHLRDSPFGAFQTSCAFQQYKKSIWNFKFQEIMFNRTCTTFDFHHVEQTVTKKLESVIEGWGEYGQCKVWFQTRIMFFYAHVLLTNIVAAFVFQCKKKKQPNEAGALKGVFSLPGQRPHPKYYLNHFE